MTKTQWNNTTKYLNELSLDICKDNECNEENHNCESYAYFTKTGKHWELSDVCISDYANRCYEGYIPMPFDGTGEELKTLIIESEL